MGTGTGTAATAARQYSSQQVHYLRKGFTFADDGSTLTVGIIPTGAQIIKPMSGVAVNVAFNAGSTNVLDIGTPADADLYATDLALGSIAFVALDEAVSMTVAADTTITATVDLTGTAATTGQGEIVICYAVDNDG
jgi:hypothetical protein